MSIITPQLKVRLKNSQELDFRIDRVKNKPIKTKLIKAMFIKEYMSNGFNATKAYMSIKPEVKSLTVASRLGSNLLKDNRELIVRLLPDLELEAGVVRDALTAPTPKIISHKDKLAYLKTSWETKGLLNSGDNHSKVNIGLVVNP